MKLMLFLLLIVLIGACGGEKNNNASPKEKFDAIEKFVGNDNWRLSSANDSGYIYFSRVAHTKIRVYSYQLEKGDSINTRIVEITADKDNNIYWPLDNTRYKLISIDGGLIKWDSQDKDMQTRAIMQQFDSTHLLLTINSGKVWMLEKTLPLATFLVRARYDYEHGTSYVDSPLVKPRKPVIVK